MSKRIVRRSAVALGAFFFLAAISLAAKTATMQQKALLTAKEASDSVDVPSMQPELTHLFGAGSCPLPKDVQADLNLQQGEGNVPNDLIGLLDKDYKAPASKIGSTYARAVLHRVEVNLRGQWQVLTLDGTRTFSESDPLSFVDQHNLSNIIYTLDCSGYMNAALAASTGYFHFAKFSSDAQTAMAAKASFAVVDAYAYSPVAIAINPGLSPIKLPPADRVDILYAIEVEAFNAWQTGDDTQKPMPGASPIRSWHKVHLIWTSNTGQSSFNGQVAISTNINAGLAGTNADVSAGVGGSLSRSVTFAKFDTYILDEPLKDTVPSTLDGLHRDLINLMQHTDPPTTGPIQGGVSAVYSGIPASICQLTWSASASGANDASVQTSFDDTGCKFTVRSNANLVGQLVTLTAPTGLDYDSSDQFKLGFVAHQ
jgi:hypothetical protein